MNDDEALAEKQRRMSSEARKSISMTPLGEILAKRLRATSPEHGKYVQSCSSLPRWEGSRNRRFIVVKGNPKGGGVNVIWVDDDDACLREYGSDKLRLHTLDDEGFMERKDWHSYTMISGFRQENVYAIRCPASLSYDERQKIEFDDPPGHYEARLRAARLESDSQRSGRGADEDETFS